VRTAYDGMEAIASIGAQHADVILLDVGLPKLNGYETCTALRQLPDGDTMVILAVTGWGADSDLQLAMDAGFDAHLVKPIDMSQLAQLLPLSREEVRVQHQIHQLRSGRTPRMPDAPRSVT